MRSRRRADEDLSKKVFAYFTTEEYKAVQKAAKLERRSLTALSPSPPLMQPVQLFAKPHRNQSSLRRRRLQHQAQPHRTSGRKRVRTLMIASAVASLGAWTWIILGVALIGIELMAPGVFFIWLGLAAIATGLIDAAFDLSWQLASLVFAVLAVVAVAFGRALARPQNQHDTQAASLNRRGEALVGRIFTLDAPIVDGAGRIRVDDSSWRVIGPERPAGSRIRVVRVEGTSLVVEDAS